MNEPLIFIKNTHTLYSVLLSKRIFPLVKVHLKRLFLYGVYLHRRISFNVLLVFRFYAMNFQFMK